MQGADYMRLLSLRSAPLPSLTMTLCLYLDIPTVLSCAACREVTAENQSLRCQVQVLERSMARMCHQQQQGDALASLALQLGGSHIAAMLAGQGAAGATHEGLPEPSGQDFACTPGSGWESWR